MNIQKNEPHGIGIHDITSPSNNMFHKEQNYASLDIVNEIHAFFPQHLIGSSLIPKCVHSHHNHTNEQDTKVNDQKLVNPNVQHFIILFTIDVNRWKGIMDSSWNGRHMVRFQQGNIKHRMDFHKTQKLELKNTRH